MAATPPPASTGSAGRSGTGATTAAEGCRGDALDNFALPAAGTTVRKGSQDRFLVSKHAYAEISTIMSCAEKCLDSSGCKGFAVDDRIADPSARFPPARTS